MKKLYIIVVTYFLAVSAFAQNPALSWLNAIGGSGDEFMRTMCSDASGNIYIGGTYQNTVDFDPSGAVNSKTAAGSSDGFVAKFNSVGQLLWVNSLGGTGLDAVVGITADANGVYVTGYYSGTANFNPSGSTVKTSVSGSADIFIAKYSLANGSIVFVNSFGSASLDYGSSIASDGSNIYLAGGFNGTVNFDPSGSSGASRTSRGSYDMFIAKYSSTGTYSWVDAIGSTGEDVALAIDVDASLSTVWVGGYYSAYLYADPNDNSVGLSNGGNTDGYIGHYETTTGNLKWGGYVSTNGADLVSAIQRENVGLIVGGQIGGSGSIFGDNGTTKNIATAGGIDSFVGRFDLSNQTLSWINVFGSSSNNEYLNGLTAVGGSICVVGSFATTMDVDPSNAVVNLTNTTASLNPYFIKYNWIDGAYISSMSMGDTGDDEPAGIISASGVLYWGGIFEGTNVDLDPGVGVNTRTSAGSYDMFLSRLNASEPLVSPPSVSSITATSSSIRIDINEAAVRPDGYLLVYKAGSAITSATPVDGVDYASNASLGDGKVLFASVQPSFQFSADPNTAFYFAIYPYNGDYAAKNYKTTSPLTTNISTPPPIAEPTAQPTNLVFSNIIAHGFDFGFTKSTGSNVTGYIGIRATNAPPTFVPVDGASYSGGTQVNATNDQVVSFVSAGNVFYYDNVDENTTYYFKIYSYNSNDQGEINYLQTNPLTGNVKTADPSTDVTGPVIEEDNSPETTAPNTEVIISLVITDDNSGVESVRLTVYPINSLTSEVFDMIRSEDERDTWIHAVPASYAADQGFEYAVRAIDAKTNYTDTPFTSVVLTYTGTGLPITYRAGSDQTNYSIISIPLDLTNNNASAVFDEFSFDKTKMRLFRYNGTSNTELSGSDKIKIGEGYWFIASEAKTLGTGAGTTAQVGDQEPFYIKVNNGWNQIGNPYNFTLKWSWVTDNSENEDKVLTTLKTYDGSWNNSATELKKMTGAFIMVQDKGDGNLRIPVYDASNDRVTAPLNFNQSLTSNFWAVDLYLKSGSINSVGGFGMHPDASEQNDKYDDFTVPRFMDYLELNYNKKLFGSAFSKDIVPTSTKHVWEFEVESNVASEIVELIWDNSNFGSSNTQLVLWDVEQQRAVDMKSEASYTFQRGVSKTFKIYYGDDAFVKSETLPFRAVFHSASPVPSSGNVTFAFSVPESNANTNTNLTIYSVMGQKVANLIDNTLPAGYHKTVWNIEDGVKPAAGIYISVLKYGDTTLQKRIVIK